MTRLFLNEGLGIEANRNEVQHGEGVATGAGASDSERKGCFH